MKIALVSDIHLEFAPLDLKNDQNADVLILSGDIIPVHAIDRDHVRDFFAQVSKNFNQVFYIMGNHEFYHGQWYKSIVKLREAMKEFGSNIKVFEQDSFEFGEYHFLGATLWTDMNRGDPITHHVCSNGMADFHIIRNDTLGYTKLRPNHTIIRHLESVRFFKETIAKNSDKKYIIMTHHGPSHLSIHERFKDDQYMNGAFVSDLSNFILDHPQIKFWTHGHVHNEFDYMIGDCRIIANPRGYVPHERKIDDPYFPKVVEV